MQSLKRNWPAWLTSVVVHAVVLMILAAITWTIARPTETQVVLELGAADELSGGESAPGGGMTNELPTDSREDDQEMRPAPTSAVQIPAPPTESEIPIPAIPLQITGMASASDPAMALLDAMSESTESAESIGGIGADALKGTSGEFQRALRGLGRRGLDVVLVIDATDSMAPYIGQAKRRLRDIIAVITGLLDAASPDRPNRNRVRFGIVAFKDYDADYGLDATKHLPLTNDQDQVFEFVNDISASGGGDIPEPIHRALQIATNGRKMKWKAGRMSMIVLVGDAPIHSIGRKSAFERAEKFARRYKGQINVIDVGGSRHTEQPREDVLADLAGIAKAGNGSPFLLTDETAFWRHLIISVFGRQFENDVEQIVRRFAKE